MYVTIHNSARASAVGMETTNLGKLTVGDHPTENTGIPGDLYGGDHALPDKIG